MLGVCQRDDGCDREERATAALERKFVKSTVMKQIQQATVGLSIKIADKHMCTGCIVHHLDT